MLVSDVDMLTDGAAVEIQEVFGQRLAVPRNGNLNFAQSLVEQVAGDFDLTKLRSRAAFTRPLTVIQRMEARAQQSYLGKIKELEDNLQQTQEKLAALQKTRAGAQAATMSPEQQDRSGELQEKGEPEPPKGIGSLDVPDRHIYCLDLRDFNQHDPYVNEIRRIAEECKARHEQKHAHRGARRRWCRSASTWARGARGRARIRAGTEFLQTAGRRWYPVIDYSRCTNCMECIDFCLFGVYGVDGQERILVEKQDNCKKGCPACSRVCPEQAIMFPDYKTPAIAGAPVGAIGNLKIDLTKLFGGGEKDALSQAVEERDRELVADGRNAVGRDGRPPEAAREQG